MSNQAWDNQVKAINAQHRYERLLIISRDLYKLIFDYQNPDYKWTCNEYGQFFKELDKLAKEFDSKPWKTSAILENHYKIRAIVEKANIEWHATQAGKLNAK